MTRELEEIANVCMEYYMFILCLVITLGSESFTATK